MPLKIFIPKNVPSSKNGRRWTGNRLIASKAVMRYRKETKKYWLDNKEKFIEEFSKYEKPVKVRFLFVRGTKHKWDYTNPIQTVQDDMVTHGWIEDDNSDIIKPIFEDYKYDKKNPGVYISLIEEDNKLKQT